MPPAPKPSSPTSDRKTLGDSAEVVKVVEGLDGELMELKASYEQYFLGVERRPPADKHRQLKKKLNDLRNTFVRQTSVKFRVNTLQQKFSTYERLWNRTLQEIEDGTYKRDLFKAKLRNPTRAEREADADSRRLEAELEAAERADAERIEALQKEKAEREAKEREEIARLAAAAASQLKVSAPTKPVSNPGSGVFVAAKPKTISSPGLQAVVPPNSSPPVRQPPANQVNTVVPGLNAVKVPSGVTIAVKPASSAAIPAVGAPTRPVSNPGLTAAAPTRPVSNPGLTAAAPNRPVSSPGLTAAARPPPPPPGAGARPGAPVSAAGGGGLTDQKVKAIYDAYVTAKRRCNEDTSSLSLDAVASTLRKQVPELMKTHNAKSVDFKVVIKDGKAVLRAVPKE